MLAYPVTQVLHFTLSISTLARKPLKELLSTNNQWIWDSPQGIAFTKLKSPLSSNEILALHYPALHTIVFIDPSAYRLGVVLHQPQANGHLYPVAYISRALTEIE